MRNVVHDGFEQIVNAGARFAACENRIISGYGKTVLDLGANTLGLGGGKIDLVNKRNDFEVRVHGHHGVCHGLGLDALRGIDNQHRALACRKGARNLVGEVHMARSIDEVEMVELPIVGTVVDANRLALDGDAAFALNVHRVEHLLLHVALGNRFRHLEDAVGKRGFAVVDMGNDGEISNVARIESHSFLTNVRESACKHVKLQQPHYAATH